MHLVFFVGLNIVFAAKSIPNNIDNMKWDNDSGSLISLHGAKPSDIRSIEGMNNNSGTIMKKVSAEPKSNTNSIEIRKPFEQQKFIGSDGKELILTEKGMFKTRSLKMIDLGRKDESTTNTPTISKEEGLKTEKLRNLELDMTILQAEWNKSRESYAKLSADWKKSIALHIILMRNEWQNVIDYDAKPNTKANFFEKYFNKERNKIVEEALNYKNMHKQNLNNKSIAINKKWTELFNVFDKIVKLGDNIEKAYFDGYNWITTFNEHKDISTRKKNMLLEFKSFKEAYINVQKLWENCKSITVSVSNTDDSKSTIFKDDLDILKTVKIPKLIQIGIKMISEMQIFKNEISEMKKKLNMMLLNGIFLTSMRKSRHVDLDKKLGIIYENNLDLRINLKKLDIVLNEYKKYGEEQKTLYILIRNFNYKYPRNFYTTSKELLPWAPFIICSSNIRETDVFTAIDLNRSINNDLKIYITKMKQSIVDLEGMIAQRKYESKTSQQVLNE